VGWFGSGMGWDVKSEGDKKERNHPTCVNDTIPGLQHELFFILYYPDFRRGGEVH
jgi:hypothetical protein